jgi:hypothetical protein
LKKDFPGLDLNVRESNLSEEAAYKITYPMAEAKWVPSPEFPSAACMTYYNQIKSHIRYFAVCGAKGCVRACMDSLEKRKAIGQCRFPTKVFQRKQWELTPPSEDKTGGIAERKFAENYNLPDPAPGSWS